MMELKESSIIAYLWNLWPQVIQKENQMSLIFEHIEKIVELAHQDGGYGFDNMIWDDVQELTKSQENGLT